MLRSHSQPNWSYFAKKTSLRFKSLLIKQNRFNTYIFSCCYQYYYLTYYGVVMKQLRTCAVRASRNAHAANSTVHWASYLNYRPVIFDWGALLYTPTKPARTRAYVLRQKFGISGMGVIGRFTRPLGITHPYPILPLPG